MFDFESQVRLEKVKEIIIRKFETNEVIEVDVKYWHVNQKIFMSLNGTKTKQNTFYITIKDTYCSSQYI